MSTKQGVAVLATTLNRDSSPRNGKYQDVMNTINSKV